MSLSPSNLFANFSVLRSASEGQWVVVHLLKHPSFICFVASATTLRTSVMLFTMISDIAGNDGIFSV